MRRPTAIALALALCLGATLLYGWYQLAAVPEGSAHVRVALVQANVTTRYSMSPREQSSCW